MCRPVRSRGGGILPGERPDAQSGIAAYALAAVAWAKETGIVNGRDGNRFEPKESATRGEVAVVLANYAKRNGATPEATPIQADIFRLERTTPYASSSNGPVLYGEALDELRAESVPELKAYPDIDRYDTILLGYCNWWSSIPAPVRSFLLHNNFGGKTIVPFCSMGGGHFGQTISAIAKLDPNSVIKEGLEVTHSSYDSTDAESYDLTGKTIVPFCTSGTASFFSNSKNLAPAGEKT